MKEVRWLIPLLLGAILLAGAFLILRKKPVPDKVTPVIPRQTKTELQTPPPEEIVEESTPEKTALPPKVEKKRPVEEEIFDRLLAAIQSWDKDRIRKVLDELLAIITPEPIPDDQNAAILYMEAFDKLSVLSDGEEAAIFSFNTGESLSEEQKELLRRYLEKNRTVIEMIEEGDQRPGCNFKVEWSDGYFTQLPHISRMINLQGLVLLRSKLGEGEDALRSAEIAARFGDSLASEPIIVSQLIQNTLITKSHNFLQENWNPEEYGPAFTNSLQSRDFGKGMQRAILGELYSSAMLFIKKTDEDLGIPDPSQNPNWALDLEILTKLYQEIYHLSPRPYHEIREELSEIETRIEIAPQFAEITQEVTPSVARIFQHRAKAQATTGTQRIAIALAEYRTTEGNYPPSLAGLKSISPGLLEDPFTGQSYQYRREGNGFVLYSVGEDGLDNGGNSSEKDIIFRVGK